MIRRASVLALTALMALPASAMAAEPESCSTRERVLSHLQGACKEAPVGMGRASNGGVIEMLRSSNGASFTIIITMPNGMTCMIAAGDSWEDLPKSLARGPRI